MFSIFFPNNIFNKW